MDGYLLLATACDGTLATTAQFTSVRVVCNNTLAITPPVVGRISIGRVIERNGKRLPEKDDQFTLTTQVQNREGWLLHPLDEKLRKVSDGQKLRSIPVRLLFNDPALNLRADYSLFNRENGRPVCVGNGETCRRTGKEGMENLPCPGPDACAFAKGDCKAYARLNVVVGDGEDDALGSFVLRTTSYNTRGAASLNRTLMLTEFKPRSSRET